MKRVAMVCFVLQLLFVLYAADNVFLDPFSATSTNNVNADARYDIHDINTTLPVGVESSSFYHCLEILNLQERQNARIEIMFMSDVSPDIQLYARSIEQTWNNGDFDAALEMFEQLNSIPEVQGNAVIGIMWRTPIPAPVSEWGDDVLISTRDSVFVLAMDRDNATNNLFAMIGFTGDGTGSKWTANFSSDGGASWVETYSLGGFSYVMNDIDACASDDHFWVAYTGGVAHNSACVLKRFQASNGLPVNMPNGLSVHILFSTTPPDTIMDVEITSNHDQSNSRVYTFAITKNSSVRGFWGYTSQVNWTEWIMGITGARQGLDANWNYGFTTHALLLTFISNTDEVKAYGGPSPTWTMLDSYNTNDTWGYWTTSCGAWRDTLFYTFNYLGVEAQVRYRIQYGSGSSWLYGFLAPDTLVDCVTPDVTLRNGGGIHGTYRGPVMITSYYRSRGYTGAWATPVHFNDQFAAFHVRPEIENVGGGNYGILYLTEIGVTGRCYFDRSDWSSGVSEYKEENAFASYISLAPNPVRDLTRLSFVTQNQGRVVVTLYDIAGRSIENVLDASVEAGTHAVNIQTHDLAAGIYFVRVESPDGTGSRTMTIVR